MAEPVRAPTEIQTLTAPDAAVESGHALHVAAFPGDSRRSSRPASPQSTERTPLLQPYARSHVIERHSEEAHPAARASSSLSLHVSFFAAAALSYVNWAFFILTALSTVHYTVAGNLLPHHASTFLPLWLSFLGGLTALLHLLDFAYPKRTPATAAMVLNIAVAVLLLAELLLLALVKELRIKESYLTLVVVSVAFVTYVVASIRPRLSNNPPPFFPVESLQHDHREPEGGWEKFKHLLKGFLSLLTITFPLFLVHVVIFLCSLSILLNICLRAYDASLAQPGTMTWVNPTHWQFRAQGLIETVKPSSWLAFRLHLHCVGGDDWEGRTILYDGPASRAGSLGADWIHDYVRNNTHSSIRSCSYDRPGYGFSDNAATASFEFVSRALEEALDKNGEYARVSKPGGGFVVVGDGYGGLLSRVFAARNAQHIHSLLFLDPQTETTYFTRLQSSIKRDLTFFFRDVIGSLLTPLGLHRRESRIYGTAANGLSASFPRSALQQAHEAHTDSQSWLSLKHSLRSFPSDLPSILISSADRLHQHSQWQAGHERLADEVLGKGLIRWDRVKAGHRVCEDTKAGASTCAQALTDLLHTKQPKHPGHHQEQG